MNILRNFVDTWYEKNKAALFAKTQDDPEKAHEQFVRSSNILHSTGLERLFLNCSENRRGKYQRYQISNAAGFNKNGNIPPTFLKYLGFDRVVVGTVGYEPWPGNPRPRIIRYPETQSMVNWMGLPGIGAEAVARNLESYGYHKISLTINVMATPGKKDSAALNDIQKTIITTRDLSYVSRFELNTSCPNTHSASGKEDARKEYQDSLEAMIQTAKENMHHDQKLYLKVSPDLEEDEIQTTIQIAHECGVKGFTTTNTTTFHDPRYITSSPNQKGIGGASGQALYERSRKVQESFNDKIIKSGYDLSLIACGGINSPTKAKERTEQKEVLGIQIFTPLIFKGPKLLRELRQWNF